MISALRARITKPVEQYGFANLAWYLLARVASRVSFGRIRIYRYLLVAQPVPPLDQTSARRSAATEVREVAPDDQIVRRFPRPPGVIQQRFDSGAKCLVATIKGEFAGYLWLSFGRYEEDEVRCLYELPCANASAWDFDVYVAPKYRLGRTLARLWESAFDLLRQRGIDWSCSRISAFNPDSVAAHRRLGMKPVGTAVFFQAGGFQFTILPHRPFVHLAPGTNSLPTIRVRPPEGGLSETMSGLL